MCRINYEIQTITSQLVFYLKNAELADKVATAFTVLLPLGGVVGESFRILACAVSSSDTLIFQVSQSSGHCWTTMVQGSPQWS